MSRFVEQFKVMLGAAPSKPEKVSDAVKQIMTVKFADKAEFNRRKLAQRDLHGKSHVWRNRRWAVLLLTNLLFVFSFWLDIQLLEGALTASRFAGFHFIDLNSALQVMLAHKHIIVNLFIGTFTVFLLWVLLGGRSFCSWVCPYHLLSEWADKLHVYLVEKKKIREHDFHRGVRTVFWLLFGGMALVSGFTVFETLSPTGILSRALIYGPGLGLGWVAILLLFEVFYSRRAWCRYICPIGLTYGVVGTLSPVQVVYRVNDCTHEGDCRKVCLVPHVLEVTVKGRAPEVANSLGPDCTRCGLCVDTCPTGSLRFEVKGLSRLL